MKSLLRPILAAGFAAGTALVLSTGCVDNRASIYISAVLAPTPPQCSVTADPTSTQFLRGRLDIAIKDGYVASLLVGNQLTPRGDKAQAKAETMRIGLNAAEITLLNAVGEQVTCPDDEDCASFSIYGTGTITVNKGDDPAWGLFSAQLIPPIVVDAIRGEIEASGTQTIVASVKVRGETLGGKEIESGEFVFPIDVCNGCLIEYSAPGPCCEPTSDSADEEIGCRPGQDGTPLPCGFCNTGDRNDLCNRGDPGLTCPGDPPP